LRGVATVATNICNQRAQKIGDMLLLRIGKGKVPVDDGGVGLVFAKVLDMIDDSRT
jgi:hypothetical protein